CCMQDAYNLGWKLALVVQGKARPELLDTYERERRPIAEQVIWAASSLHDIFMGHGRDIRERAQRMNEPGFVEAVVGRCSGISYTYRDSAEAPPALAALEGPAIGDRAPDAELGDGRALFDLTRHTGFTLLAVPGRAGLTDPAAPFGEVRDRFGDLVACHTVEPSPSLTRAYGPAEEARLYLLRPDGYIGFRCTAAESGRLIDHLADTLVPI